MVDLQPTEMTAKTSDQNNRMPRVLIILEATPKQSLQLHLRKVCTQFESANGVRKEVTRPQCASKDTLTAQMRYINQTEGTWGFTPTREVEPFGESRLPT